MKILHLADLHIRNAKYFDEYKIFFDAFYKKLEEIKPDILVMAGDFGHTKTAISGDFVKLYSEFMIRVSDIMSDGKIIKILGNHDANMRTEKRVDALSPVLDLINKGNIILIKDTDNYYDVGNIRFTLKDCFDDDPVPSVSNSGDMVNILLYHGIVKGALTKTGYTFDTGIDIEEIMEKGYDFGMFGDIHSNQFFDIENGGKTPRFGYSGSAIQQNHGEGKEKGFLVWDIKNKNDYSVEFIELPESTMFYTFNSIDEYKNNIENINFKNLPKIRIVLDKNIDKSERIEIANYLRREKKATDVAFVPEYKNADQTITELYNQAEDSRNVEYQNALLKNFYKGKKEVDVDSLIELNKGFIIPKELSEIGTGRYDIVKIEAENMFAGGSTNIDLSSFNDNHIVGLFAPNGTGKSNTINTILYGINHNIAKKIKKTAEVINNKESEASVDIQLRSNGKHYLISTKIKRNKEDTAEQTVKFNECNADGSIIKNESGESVKETQRNIRNKFGSIDTNILTSICPQFRASDLFQKEPSERKEFLSKLLGLEAFEEKYKMAKPKLLTLDNKIKELEKNDCWGSIKVASGKIMDLNKELKTTDKEINELEIKADVDCRVVDGLKGELKLLDTLPKNLRSEKDIENDIVKHSILSLFNFIKKEYSTAEQSELEKTLKDNDKDYSEDIARIKLEIKEIEKQEKDRHSTELEIKTLESDKKNAEKKASLLDELSCPTENKNSCRFTKDANDSKLLIPDITQKIIELNEKLMSFNLESKKEELTKEGNETERKNKELHDLKYAIKTLGESSAKSENEYLSLSTKIETLQKELDESNKVRDSFNSKSTLENNLNKKEKEYNELLKEIEKKGKEHDNLNIEIGKQKGLVKTYEDIIEEVKKTKKEYDIYKNYTEAMSKSGIPYQLIKNKLGHINSEIFKILSEMCTFRCYVADENEKLEIYLEDVKGKRRIELAGGAETSLCAIAVRAALTNITPLPHSSMFIIDEGFESLDADNLSNMNMLFRNLKNIFNTVLIITHKAELKEFVDATISLEVIDDRTYVRNN